MLGRALAWLAARARAEEADLARESGAEEAANAITHGIGAGLALVALVLGVIYAARTGSAWAIVATAIYGVTLLFLFSVSTFYHALVRPGPKRLFLALDHCAIFLLIAGTYTAVALSTMHGLWQGWVMLGVVWGLAIAGIVLRLAWLRYMHPLFIALYVVMGWVGFAFADAVEATIGRQGIELMIIGGVCYTGGIVLYALRRLPFNHALWHLAVIAGAVVHFLAVYEHVIPRAA